MEKEKKTENLNKSSEVLEYYHILKQGGKGEIVEKKSRFIATLRPVSCEEEAVFFIEEMKKRYWDARHNCSAFVIGPRAELTRCSDDGEPGGTAGRPMLEVLLQKGVRNAAVVVTRYFGGTLLGTGGLVRAYTQAVQEGLCACKIVTLTYGTKLELYTDYNGVGKILYLLEKQEVKVTDSEYTDAVRLTIMVPTGKKDKLQKEMIQATAGKCRIEERESFYFETGNSV